MPDKRHRSDFYKTIHRSCGVCGKSLVLNNNRDIERKHYCSKSCNSKAAIATQQSRNRGYSKICKKCELPFVAVVGFQKYCSHSCQSSAAATAYAIRRAGTTAEQFIRYLLRHCGARKTRDAISPEAAIALFYRQCGKCALSGIPMTWMRSKGRIGTNISIDRIIPSGEYSLDNVQLVCLSVNMMKRSMSDVEFKSWCRLIAENSHSISLAKAA